MRKSKKLKKYRTKIDNFYPVIVEEDMAGGYVVSCPIFDGCYSQGETVEEALKNIKEAILLCLEEMSVPKKEQQLNAYSLHMVKV